VVIARSWWRKLVGGEFGGVRWSIGVVVFWGSRETLVGCRHRRSDVHVRRHSFLKGIGCTIPTPLYIPGETLGTLRAAASSSSHPFLKVLLGIYAELDVLRAWWNSPKGAAIADHLRFHRPDVLTLLSFLFHLLFLCFPYFLLG
jgi:hypothetical protein